MNYINFQQIGGFPLETETLLEVQKAYSIFNAYGKAFGDKVIISGCELVGNTISDGFIVLNEELIAFKGGVLQSKIYVKQEIEDVEFADAQLKSVYYTRYATFGTTTSSIDWADFKRIDPITTLMSRLDELEKTAAVFTSGLGSVWWRGTIANIPTGWIEDTTMRGLVPVGQLIGDSDFGTINKTSGAKTHSLIINELPSHRHSLSVNYHGNPDSPTDTHSTNRYWNDLISPKGTKYTTSEGGDKPHNNLQPYRVGLWIKREI